MHEQLTPLEKIAGIWVKRDDLYFSPKGSARGGKARTCYEMISNYKKEGKQGLVTAGSRYSPQVNIVAQIGKAFNMPVRIHSPEGKPGPEVKAALEAGAVRVAHKPGYNSVIVKRAEFDASINGWGLIPFGMECYEAVQETSYEVWSLVDLVCKGLLKEVNRIVVPVGSGMSLCGILAGLERYNLLANFDILGVVVGADPSKRLDRFFPMWRMLSNLKLEKAQTSYHTMSTDKIGHLMLDPIYEAKCVPFLQPNNLFWIVGIRDTAFQK